MKSAKIPAVVWVMMTVVAVLSFLIGVLVGGQTAGEPSAAPRTAPAVSTAPAAPAAPGSVHRREEGDAMALGEVDAPVVIAAFSDLGCPYCAQWATETLPQLADYVEDGTVRIEWHDFPVTGPSAVEAAKAGRAAAEQDRFFEFVDALYASGEELSAENFLAWAEQAGVPDLTQFEADSAGYDAEIAEARELGAALEITGTPAFVVGEESLSGAQPVEAFEALIEQQAARV